MGRDLKVFTQNLEASFKRRDSGFELRDVVTKSRLIGLTKLETD